MNDAEKDITMREAFEALKDEAREFGAGGAKLSFDDSEWRYIIEVKRIKH